MLIFELINTFIQAQLSMTCTLFSESTCPASSFNAITAAFATQGYWVQADIIHYLHFPAIGALPILLYVISAAGGLISMALGAPPKMYLWFFMGPSIAATLVHDTRQVHGVRVNVGKDSTLYGIPLPSSLEGFLGIIDTWNASLAQTEVWKLAEPGLLNTNIVKRENYVTSSYTEPFGGPNGDGTVDASGIFVFFDTIVSGVVEWLTEWSGVYDLEGGDNDYSTIASNPSNNRKPNHLLKDLKWKMIDDVTSAKLSNQDLRDSFVTFMQSECGDNLSQAINKEKFAAAMHSRGETPDSIFSLGANYNSGVNTKLMKVLNQRGSIPTPVSLKNFLLSFNNASRNGRNASLGSFENSSPLWTEQQLKDLNRNANYINEGSIECGFYFRFLIDAFRWEAAHTYYHLLTQAPVGISPKTLVYNLFYGWPGRDDIAGRMPIHMANIPGAFLVLDPERQQHFLMDLILAHLIKNEMAIAPLPYVVRRSSGQETVEYALESAKTVGSKSRFGELYTWALLLPYMQGLLLYLLTIAYPIVCCFIVMPGMHKMLFTWMSFFIWAKLWDFGFAIVAVLERSVWAMVGNRTEIGEVFGKIYKMSEYGTANVSCPGSTSPVWESPSGSIISGIPNALLASPFSLCRGAAIPNVQLISNGSDAAEQHANAIHIFDSAVAMAGSLDLDLANSWYIYIMAAMYFAVPAITGQLVLGAKAGAASLLQTAIGQQAAEAGKGAAQGYSAGYGKMLESAGMVNAQAAKSKSMRSGGASSLISGALESGNKALQGETLSAAASTASTQLGNVASGFRSGLGVGQAMQGYGRASQGWYPYGAGYIGSANAMGMGPKGQLDGFGENPEKFLMDLANGAANLGSGYDEIGRQTMSSGGNNPQPQKSDGTTTNGSQTSKASFGAMTGGGSGGGGGVGPSGQQQGGALDRLGRYINPLMAATQQYGPMFSAYDNMVFAGVSGQRQSQIDAQQSALGLESLAEGRTGSAYSAARQNYWQPAADAKATDDTHNASKAFSMQGAGSAAARGASPAGITPMAMDTQGLAAGGYAGAGAQQKAQWADPNIGGFGSWFGSTGSWAYDTSSGNYQLTGGSGVLRGVNQTSGLGEVMNNYNQWGNSNISGVQEKFGNASQNFRATVDTQGNKTQNLQGGSGGGWQNWGIPDRSAGTVNNMKIQETPQTVKAGTSILPKK